MQNVILKYNGFKIAFDISEMLRGYGIRERSLIPRDPNIDYMISIKLPVTFFDVESS